MDNDFNTAQALGHLFETVKILNKTIRLLPDSPSPEDVRLRQPTAATITRLAGVLGLLQQDPVRFWRKGSSRSLGDIDLDEEEIVQLIAKRNQARAEKDWATSDKVRDYLLAITSSFGTARRAPPGKRER